MILRPGSTDPGRGAGPSTGQRVSFIPARIAETSARLSRLLRPGTAGTVIAGGFALSAFSRAARVAESIATTVTGFIAGPLTTGGVAGCASLAAQPRMRASAASVSTEYLGVYIIVGGITSN